MLTAPTERLVHLFKAINVAAHLFTFSQGYVEQCHVVRALKWSIFLLKLLMLLSEGYSIVRFCLFLFCVTVSRFGMLSEEPVPQADSILAAVTRHLHDKLSFSKKRAQIREKKYERKI